MKTTKEITIEFEHDVNEGWACVSYYDQDGNLLAADDGSHTEFFGQDSEELVIEYWEKNGHPDPDWEAYGKAILEASFEQIKEQYADEWILIRNSYEQEYSCGFANTYYIVDSEEGEESRFGHRKAIRVSEVEDCFMDELIDWAEQTKGYSWF